MITRAETMAQRHDLQVGHCITQWGKASNLAFGPDKIKLFKGLGMEKPVWEQIMPEELWKDGNGLCTSFAISVNNSCICRKDIACQHKLSQCYAYVESNGSCLLELH
jgi:hypothetical protein